MTLLILFLTFICNYNLNIFINGINTKIKLSLIYYQKDLIIIITYINFLSLQLFKLYDFPCIEYII